MSGKPLWAPWRLDYVGGEREEGCFLCAAARAPEEPGRLVVHVGETALVLLNRYPYASGHLLIAPVEHVGEIEQVPPQTAAELWRLMVEAKRVLDDLYRPEGYNVGWNLGRAAGAGVADHLHLHVVPRWNGDNNFMPVLADVRVMPEHLEKTRRALVERFGL